MKEKKFTKNALISRVMAILRIEPWKETDQMFSSDKGQGQMDKKKTDRPPTGLRREAKSQRRGRWWAGRGCS